MFNLLIVVIYVITLENTQAYECDSYTLDSDNGGYIHSPNFPRAFPDGPYNCSYTITSGTSGNVLLEFTDLLMNRDINPKYNCRERLYIYNGANGSEVMEDEERDACLTVRFTYHISSSSDGFVVKFRVDDTNLFKVSGFRAKYSTLPESKNDWDWDGLIVNRLHDGSNLITKVTKLEHEVFNGLETDRRVIKAAPGHRLAYSIGLFDNVIGGNINIQFRDGMTSQSPLIQEFTAIPDRKVTIVTDSEYLYEKRTRNYADRFSYGYTSFLVRQGPCPSGYYKCASTDRCIGISAVCDGFDQCGDNSDEEHPSLNCNLPLTCDYPFPCYNNTRCLESANMCLCPPGLKGRKCEHKIEGCPFTCTNGGTCADYACRCNRGYYGDRCELTYDSSAKDGSSGRPNTNACIVILLPVTLWIVFLMS